jgi:hypothetical protein
MAVNVTQILGGPALVKYRGQTFYSQGDIILDSSLETFAIEVDRFREVDERTKDRMLKVRFTPAGVFTSAQDAILHPYGASLLGSLITPIYTASAVTAAADTITIAAHGIVVGTGVRLGTTGTLPAGLGAATTYFVSAPDANTIKLHLTEAHALAGTNAVDITDAGTGTLRLIQNTPLVIHTFAGRVVTLHNAAVTKMPGLRLSTTRTAIEEVEFEAFPLNNTDWDTANAVWTIADAANTDTSFDPAAIVTEPWTAQWEGEGGAWEAMAPKGPISVDFDLQLEAIETDAMGILSRRLAGVSASAKFAPQNVSESELMAKLLLQGAGAFRGRSLRGGDLLITGAQSDRRVVIYGAALKGGPQQFSSKQDRMGELEWKATRTFSAGVPDPLFLLTSV